MPWLHSKSRALNWAQTLYACGLAQCNFRASLNAEPIQRLALKGLLMLANRNVNWGLIWKLLMRAFSWHPWYHEIRGQVITKTSLNLWYCKYTQVGFKLISVQVQLTLKICLNRSLQPVGGDLLAENHCHITASKVAQDGKGSKSEVRQY